MLLSAFVTSCYPNFSTVNVVLFVVTHGPFWREYLTFECHAIHTRGRLQIRHLLKPLVMQSVARIIFQNKKLKPGVNLMKIFSYQGSEMCTV